MAGEILLIFPVIFFALSIFFVTLENFKFITTHI